MSGEAGPAADYSNAAIFASEAIATCFTIYLGESIIANELLARTKGRAMGWGFVALGFGLAFGVTIFMFGYISAHLNPATCLALWILGKMDGIEFLAASAGEFLGAFIGAFLVWLHFIPHFKTVPEPPPKDEGEWLLRSRDALTPEALNIASYSTHRNTMKRREGKTLLAGALGDIKYYLNRRNYDPDSHANLVKLALGPEELKTAPAIDSKEAALNHLRRRTVQVCDLHRRLKDIDVESFKNLAGFEFPNQIQPSTLSSTTQLPTPFANASAAAKAAFFGNGSGAYNKNNMQRVHSSGDVEPRGDIALNMDTNPPISTDAGGTERQESVVSVHPQVEHHAKKLDKMYEAAVIADQNAKLSIFATRPAIRTPFFNFLTEFMATTGLVYGALMMYARRELLFGAELALFRSYEGIWIGFFVFVCILGLGGPTGIAANPARDFSPRLAHYILPIPGKGASEWSYAWVPVFAPLVGGCAAAGLYAATQLLNNSRV